MVYFFYAAMIVGILLSAQVLATYSHNMKMMVIHSHTPAIARNIPDPELAQHIQQLSVLEYGFMTFIMIPLAILCLLAVGTLPFYFQTEIPLEIAAITSATVGLLFTYVVTKDFEPDWLILSVAMIERIVITEALKSQLTQDIINASAEDITEGEQILSESSQSHSPE
jgi:uncharacterized integral membrane protein